MSQFATKRTDMGLNMKNKRMINTVIRLIRKVNDMSVKEVSSITGYSEDTIYFLENGSKEVEDHHMEAYSNAFNIPASSLEFFASEGTKETVMQRAKLAIQVAIIKFMTKAEEL